MKRLACAATLLASTAAGAMSLAFTHPYRELVDRGNVTVHVNTSAAWDCSASSSVDMAAKRITLTGGAAPAGSPINCFAPWVAVLPALAAGKYEVTGRLVAGATVVEAATQVVEILPIAGRCNPDPALSPSIMSRPKEPAAQFVARFDADPALRALLGNPRAHLIDYHAFDDEVHFDYPPLDDIPPAMERLVTSNLFDWVAPNGRACFAAPPPDAIATFVEYYHAGLDHYFYSGDAGEIAAIDAGKVGSWARTGRSFRAVTMPGCTYSSTDTVVYRFAATRASSHFFTRDRSECYAVDKSNDWSLEGVPFYASPANADGTCPPRSNLYPAQPRVPLYRTWRPFGDSNHRFTTDRAVVAQMVAGGWVDEGVAMCVLPP